LRFLCCFRTVPRRKRNLRNLPQNKRRVQPLLGQRRFLAINAQLLISVSSTA
jgi:hypothetical protein